MIPPVAAGLRGLVEIYSAHDDLWYMSEKWWLKKSAGKGKN